MGFFFLSFPSRGGIAVASPFFLQSPIDYAKQIDGMREDDLEEFEPTEEQIKTVLEAAGFEEKRGGRREGAGRPKADGSPPEPIKPPEAKLVPIPEKNPHTEHTFDSLVGNEAPKGRGRLTRKEVERTIAEKLADAGYDPVINMVEMARDPDFHGLEIKDRIAIDKELMRYTHAQRKSVEKKEEKHWTIEVVKRDFIEDKETGEVIDVAEKVDAEGEDEVG